DRGRARRLVPDRVSRGAAVEPRRAPPLPQAGLPADRDPPRVLPGGERPRGRALPRPHAVIDPRGLKELEIDALARLYALHAAPAAATAGMEGHASDDSR